jgi:hypothetical protein
MISVLPDGTGSRVAWSDGENGIHVTPLDATDRRAGPDVVLQGDEVRGLVAHDDGVALLVVDGENLSLVRLGADGHRLFDTHLIGGGSHDVAGTKWMNEWTHEGRLVWSGERYGAYAGHAQQFGANGIHQGDLLWFFDGSGERIETRADWDWGCSHSLDLRLAHNGTRFGPVCLSDSYPSKAFHFNHRETEIRKEPSGDGSGGSDADLGGWVPLDDGFLMSFSSPEGRSSSDVGLIHVHNDGSAGSATWLTDTSAIDESAPHLARFGRNLLAGWTADGSHTLAHVELDGSFVEGPTAVDARIWDMDDMVAAPNGDVVWAFAWDDLSELKVVRVSWCDEEAVGPPGTPGTATLTPTREPTASRTATATLVGPSTTPGPPTTPPAPGTPPTPGTAVPPGCRNLLTNGDFESGFAGWDYQGEVLLRFGDLSGGRYAAMLLGRSGASGALSQRVEVPQDASSLYLTYWWLMESDEAPSSTKDYDWFSSAVFETDAVKLFEIVSNLSGRDGWLPSGYRFGGSGSILLQFSADSNTRDPTKFFIDDVQLVACTGSAPPYPSLAVQPPIGSAATEFTGRGTGFMMGERVFHWTLQAGRPLRFDGQPAVASADGSFTGRLNVTSVPGDWAWHAIGDSARLPAGTMFEIVSDVR